MFARMGSAHLKEKKRKVYLPRSMCTMKTNKKNTRIYWTMQTC